MPYTNTPEGEVMFSGKILAWINQFKSWYLQDFGNNSKVAFSMYFQNIALMYTSRAENKWQNGFFNKSKLRTLEELASQSEKAICYADIYILLDFLAENLSTNDLFSWSESIRKEFIELINKIDLNDYLNPLYLDKNGSINK